MKISVTLPVFSDPGRPDPYRPSFELAQVAEEAGFDTVTIGHHHFIAGNVSDPLTFMAAVAVRTNTIRVGTGIFLLAVHHPLQVAEQVAMVDQLSNGRISLGVGTGWWDVEYTALGSDIHQRGARIEEALRTLRQVWTEEEVSSDRRFYPFPTLTVYPRPVQRPHPPLWVAGVADAAIDRAARLGDAWLCGPVQSFNKAQGCLATYRAACARLGRPADWILRRYAWIGTSRQVIEEEKLGPMVDSQLAHWRESAEDEEERRLFARIDAGERVPPGEVAADRFLWGTPDDVIGQITRYREATGCDHLHVAFGGGLPSRTMDASAWALHAELRDMFVLFGREVIPAFA